MQYPGRCVCELLDGVLFFYGVELSSPLCTICGARDPSPPIGYVHANTIPTVTYPEITGGDLSDLWAFFAESSFLLGPHLTHIG